MAADRPHGSRRDLDSVSREQCAMVVSRCGNRAVRWLLVHVASQSLALVLNAEISQIWSVSTARAGLDNRDGSGGTPPGLHEVARRIGTGTAPGTVFVGREPTDRIWQSDEKDPDDLIVSRILTLRGLENGVNRGPGVDSEARYIYIHGTNHPDHIGKPASHGCVRMTDPDVRELFELVNEGDPVVIV